MRRRTAIVGGSTSGKASAKEPVGCLGGGSGGHGNDGDRGTFGGPGEHGGGGLRVLRRRAVYGLGDALLERLRLREYEYDDERGGECRADGYGHVIEPDCERFREHVAVAVPDDEPGSESERFDVGVRAGLAVRILLAGIGRRREPQPLGLPRPAHALPDTAP